MQIKKRLRIQVAVLVVTALVICLVFFLSLYRINKVSNLTKIAGDIVTNSLERVTFSNDYIWHNSARAKEQWFVKHKQIGRILKSASENFRSVEDRYKIGEMIKHHESIGNIFSAIVANREKSSLKPESAELSREFEDRLLNQMNMVIYDVVLHDRELLESSRKARASVLRQTGESIICLLAIAVALAGFSSWTMGWTITERVGRLRNGAAMIGGGDLDHRIEIKGDDEFAELSEAFNVMTVKLRGSHHDLETEIQMRKLAEEELLRKQSELNEAQHLAHIGSWHWDAKTDVTTGSAELLRIYGFDPGTEQMPDFEDQKGRCYPVEDWERVNAAVQITMQTGVGYKLDVVAIRCGDPIWVTTCGEVVRDADGLILGLRGTVQDITDRKKAEMLIQRHIEELDASIKELTRFNSASMGRELRMIELKREINDLCRQTGQPPRYPLDFDKEQS